MSKARWQVTDIGRAASTSRRMRSSSMRPSGRQAADDHAGDTELAAGLDVGDHAFELEPGVEKIAAARADDDVEGDRRDFQRLPDDAERGRQPALQQARAKLDTIGAAILRRDKPVDALDADLDQQRHLDHRAGIRITGG